MSSLPFQVSIQSIQSIQEEPAPWLHAVPLFPA